MSEGIEIRQVSQTPKELRGLKRGWGAFHIWSGLPWLVPYLGMIVLMTLLVKNAPWMGASIPMGITLGTVVLWILASNLASAQMQRQAAMAPSRQVTYDWIFDTDGLRQESPLTSTRVAWEAIRDVREEGDRFVVLFTPQANLVLPKRLMTEAQITGLRALIAEVRASGRLGRGVD